MTERWKSHRTLLSGLRIDALKNENGTYTKISGGTLTGLAVRNVDNKKVLVTCHHVMSGSTLVNAASGVEMHQSEYTAKGDAGTTTYSHANKVGVLLDKVEWKDGITERDELDVAICELEAEVGAESTMHDHPTHTSRKIIQGVKEPERNLELTVLGANNGVFTVTIDDEDDAMWATGFDENGNAIRRRFEHVIRLDTGEEWINPGDSGAPCLYEEEEEENRWKICGILFTGGLVTHTAYASSASKVQSALGITFGNTPPVANAGLDQVVALGATVTLDGSKSSDDDSGDTLTYLWEQVPDVLHTVSLSSATAAKPTFTAPTVLASLSFRLTVTDSKGDKATDNVSIDVGAPPNRAPVANAGDNQTVYVGALVTLNARVPTRTPATP